MNKKSNIILLVIIFLSKPGFSQIGQNFITSNNQSFSNCLVIFFSILPLVIFIGSLYFNFLKLIGQKNQAQVSTARLDFKEYLKNLSKVQIEKYYKIKKIKCDGKCNGSCVKLKSVAVVLFLFFLNSYGFAQTGTSTKVVMSQPGIVITIVLLMIPVLLGVVYALILVNNSIKHYLNSKKIVDAEKLATFITTNEDSDLEIEIAKRKKSLDFELTNVELSGSEAPVDAKVLLHNVSDKHEVHFTALKKKAAQRPSIDADVSMLILWYLGCAAFWLVVGTGIGEYVGMKFVAPDLDHISWLSFGRIRPVHTNIVFWGWASLGMIGLGYYVVPMVSNAKIYNIKWGWIALVLTNLMVILGSICLMSGMSNGGGEFREYIWPVMALFAVALILTLANFLLTVANRTTKEIYISNWYIISAIIFTIIVALVAYLPFWQDGVSETIVQGYFMHSGVGMWFTLYTLGLLYYFIPQQINKPIYAYSLGILAFWTQILFYTLIGTHHFIFAPLPWWLQTVAIVGSVGMIIPVVAATINFTMTFKGQWNKISHSYTLPFFLVAVMYYLIVSLQGTAEAFKFTNLIWHFTDFTIAHAHLGFYGIITFAIWGGVYTIVPRLTGKEPPQHLVGAHFWLAFIGLLFYTIPLSIGATLRGLMWAEGKPFIDSVVLMFDFWLWRAIGGSIMFISHILFFYNFFKMTVKEVEEIDIKEEAFKILENQVQTNQ